MPIVATVLLVEDEPILLEVLCEALERAGHTVCSAPSREAAIRIGQTPNSTIDVLLCDVLVGPENGFEIAAHLKATHPDALVILMSGSPSETFSLAGIAYKFLQKPFAVKKLLSTIAQRTTPGDTHEIWD